jgi:hypothetical protein
MFSEVLKIIPKLDNSQAANMERSLNSRFKNVSKKFGGALKIAAVAGLGSAFVSQILNPLNDVKATIKATLTKADDIVTYATQFNTTPEKLAKLQSFASLKGLESDNLYMLLNKFQGAVAQTKADPTKPSAVRNYTNIPDTADAFFEFIQALQKMAPNEQNIVQQSVFGEKQILKMSEFLQSNFKESNSALAKVNFKNLGVALQSLESVESLQKREEVINGLNDLIQKSLVINSGTVQSESLADRLKNARENKQIADFDRMTELNNQIEEMKEMLRNASTTILKEFPVIMQAVKRSISGWEMIAKALPGARGFKYGQGKNE